MDLSTLVLILLNPAGLILAIMSTEANENNTIYTMALDILYTRLAILIFKVTIIVNLVINPWF